MRRERESSEQQEMSPDTAWPSPPLGQQPGDNSLVIPGFSTLASFFTFHLVKSFDSQRNGVWEGLGLQAEGSDTVSLTDPYTSAEESGGKCRSLGNLRLF